MSDSPGRRMPGRVLDVDLEAFLLQHVGDDGRALLRLVAAPAAPYDQCISHCLYLPLFRWCLVERAETKRRSAAWPGARARRDRDVRPRSDDTWIASITSSTCKASSPDARCGRPDRMACAMSATPMIRKLPSVYVLGRKFGPFLGRAGNRAPPKRLGSGTCRLASVPYNSIGLWRASERRSSWRSTRPHRRQIRAYRPCAFRP